MKKSRTMFFLSLVFAGLAAWMANSWVQMQTKSNKQQAANEKTTQIVVATTNIKYGQTIDAVHLKMQAWPDHILPPGWIDDVSKIQGRVAKWEIGAGEPITHGRIVEHLAGSKLSALIPKNKRAMTIRVDDVVGVAGFLLPGNRVDVFGVRKNNRTKLVKVKTVLSDVKVLAVDQDAKRSGDNPKVVRAVTLEVSPHQAKQLVKAMNEGRIQLALRNPIDRLEKPLAKTKKVRRRVKRKTNPAPVAKSDKVTVIRGTNVAKVDASLEEGGSNE